jgi:deoxyribose-phosphate aldolase
MPSRNAVDDLTVGAVVKAVDHLVLAPDQTFQDIEQACRDAAEYKFASVCLPPYAVSYGARLLRGTGVVICGTVGIPLGYSGLRAKCDEASTSIEAGAGEIDMAINLVAMKSSRYADVQKEVAAVRRLATGLVLKATLECCYLNDAEKIRAANLALDAGADVIKTHTGFGKAGVRLHDVQLLKRALGMSVEIEAAGGITRFKQFHDMLCAGATRVGVEAAVALIKDFYKWEAA